MSAAQVQQLYTGKHDRLTSIPDGKASKLARAPVVIHAALDQRGYEAMAVQGSVEVGRVAAHVAQQVAHTRPHRRLSVAEQLAQLGVGGGCGQGGVVVPVQPCQLAGRQEGADKHCWRVAVQQEPAW